MDSLGLPEWVLIMLAIGLSYWAGLSDGIATRARKGEDRD